MNLVCQFEPFYTLKKRVGHKIRVIDVLSNLKI